MSIKKISKKAGYTGLFAAIAASSCCMPPVIALIVGVGGGASALSWMEPFRPYLIGLAIVTIGYAWYNYLKPKKAEDCCEVDVKPKWYQTKGFLIAITLFAAISISFPYYAHIFYPDNKKEIVIINQSDIQTVNFGVQGMTCASCEESIKHAINELDGIVSVTPSFEKENTEVKFDKTKISKEDIEEAINSTGYKVNEKKEN